jgi:hypothetical protein
MKGDHYIFAFLKLDKDKVLLCEIINQSTIIIML